MASRGFTLLEILVALAILAVVMTAALHGSGAAAQNVGYLKQRTMAHWVAMNKSTELQLATNWVALKEERGQSVMAGQEWSWTVVGQATPDPTVRRADVAVWAGAERAGDPLATLVIYVGKP